MTAIRNARPRAKKADIALFRVAGTPSELQVYFDALDTFLVRQSIAVSRKIDWFLTSDDHGPDEATFRMPLEQLVQWLRVEVALINGNPAPR